MKIKIVLLSLVFLLLPVIQKSATVNAADASPKFAQGVLDNSTKTYSLSSSQTLIVNKVDKLLQVVDLSSQTIKWNKTLPVIYDSQVLSSPLKIVVITSENNKPKKVVFSATGKVLSEQFFPNIKINNTIHSLAWSPASSGQPERLALINKKQILVYQYPWKKSLALNYHSSDESKFENVIVNDLQINSSYIALKLTGDALMQSQDIFRVFNLNSRDKHSFYMQSNTDSKMSFEGNELVLNTSSQLGNPLGIDASVSHDIYTRYDLKNWTLSKVITEKYSSNQTNWRSDYFNNKLVLMNTEQNTFSVYDKNGTLLKVINYKPETLSNRFIGLYNNQAFIFKYSSKEKIVELTAFSLN